MGIVTPTQKFTKKPEEVLPRRVRYANQLPIGTRLDTVVVTATDAEGNDITSVVLEDDSAVILEDEQKVEFYVKGGTPGLRAVFKVVVTLDDTPIATKLVDYVVMIVRE